MARYGSERIRGHGIPEAIESILLNGSRVQPRVAILKPLSSAISIGSGGPFGAEGPIIMTGGAFGSLIAQFFHLSERGTQDAASRRRSGRHVGDIRRASVGRAACRRVAVVRMEAAQRHSGGIGERGRRARRGGTFSAWDRYFQFLRTTRSSGRWALLGCVVAGLLAGLFSALLTKAVYAAEDAFQRLPIHWMWWPAIGGLVIGLGGLVFPQALGVGYETIGALLQGDLPRATLAGILVVKLVIWAVALGSGTSGGVLAPLLMLGGALGGVEAMFLPHQGVGFWPLISMGAILGGTMRSPFTGIVFAIELTHDFNALLAFADRQCFRLRRDGAAVETVHSDRETQPPRISSQPRIFRRSARNSFRSRGDAHQRPCISSRGNSQRVRATVPARIIPRAGSIYIRFWMATGRWRASSPGKIWKRF